MARRSRAGHVGGAQRREYSAVHAVGMRGSGVARQCVCPQPPPCSLSLRRYDTPSQSQLTCASHIHILRLFCLSLSMSHLGACPISGRMSRFSVKIDVRHQVLRARIVPNSAPLHGNISTVSCCCTRAYPTSAGLAPRCLASSDTSPDAAEGSLPACSNRTLTRTNFTRSVIQGSLFYRTFDVRVYNFST